MQNADHRDTENHASPSSLNRKPSPCFFWDPGPGGAVSMHWHHHTLGFSHLHHVYLKLLDTHELPLFHLQALGTPRMLVCHAFFLHPAQPGVWNHTHGLPCLRSTKGPSSHPVNSIPSTFPSLSPDSDSASLPPPWPRAKTATQTRCPTQASVHKWPMYLLHQIPGVLTVSQF